MKTITVSQFDGGMINDARDVSGNTAQIIQNFDIFTNRHELTPQVSAEVGDASATSNLIVNFAYDGTTIYGLGWTPPTGTNFETFTRTDFTGSTWTALGNVGATYTTTTSQFFTYYPKTGKFYGAWSGRYIWSIPTNGAGANNAEKDLSAFTTISNGVVGTDDILYVGADHTVHRNNNGTWDEITLVLPSNLIITSLCNFNNYLAIACRPIGGSGRSRVYLWDRSSVSWNESIDWGEGNLYLIEELEGHLIGVSFQGDLVSDSLKSRMFCRYYTGGGGAVQFSELIGFNQTVPIHSTLFKFKSQNRIYFPASCPIGTTGYPGIWSIGRSSGNVPFAINLAYSYKNSVSVGLQSGLIKIGDYLFTSYVDNSVQYMDKTDDASTYATASIYESLINPSMEGRMYHLDRAKEKQLVAFACHYVPLTAGQQVVAKYRVEGGSWVTLFTETTVGKTVTEVALNALALTANRVGREFEFRLESTGGARIAGYSYKYDTNDTNI